MPRLHFVGASGGRQSTQAAAQAIGRVRSDLDADWLLDALTALVTQAAVLSHNGVPLSLEQLRLTTRSLFDVPTL